MTFSLSSTNRLAVRIRRLRLSDPLREAASGDRENNGQATWNVQAPGRQQGRGYRDRGSPGGRLRIRASFLHERLNAFGEQDHVKRLLEGFAEAIVHEAFRSRLIFAGQRNDQR